MMTETNETVATEVEPSQSPFALHCPACEQRFGGVFKRLFWGWTQQENDNTCPICEATICRSLTFYRRTVAPLIVVGIHLLVAMFADDPIYAWQFLTSLIVCNIGFLLLFAMTPVVKKETFSTSAAFSWFKISIRTCLIVVTMVAIDVSWFTLGRPWQLALEVDNHSRRISHAEFSHNSRHFVTTGDDGRIVLHDLSRNGAVVKSIHEPGTYTRLRAMFSPDSKRLLIANHVRHRFLSYDLESGKVIKLKHPRITNHAIAFQNDAQIVGILDDGTIRRWNAVTGEQESQIKFKRPNTKIAQVILSPNANLFVFSEVRSGTDPIPQHFFELEAGKERFNLVDFMRPKFSGDGKRVFGAEPRRDGNWSCHDTKTGEMMVGPIPNIQSDHLIAFSPSGRRLATNRVVRDTSTGILLSRLSKRLSGGSCITFSPNESDILICHSDGSAEVWHRYYADTSFHGIANPRLWCLILLAFGLGWSLDRDFHSTSKIEEPSENGSSDED